MRKPILIFLFFFPLLTNCAPPAIPAKTPTAEIPQIDPAANEFSTTTPNMETDQPEAKEPATVLEQATSTIRLPEWLTSPGKSEVFIANGCPSKENCQLILVDPDSQSRVHLPVHDLAVYFWLPDGRGVGLITNQQQFIKIDLASGEMITTTLSSQPLRFFPDALPSQLPLPAYAFGDVASEAWFVTREVQEFSFDQKHRVLRDFSKEEMPLSIENLKTEEVKRVTQDDDGFYDVEYAWSPAANELAILTSSVPGMPSLPGQVVYENTRILLFDANQKRMIREYEGDFANIHWSPDGRTILYQTRTADAQEPSPEACILDVQSDQRKCFGTIAKETVEAYTTDYQWLPDRSGLSYLKLANSGEVNHFCIYKIQEDRVDCPSEEVSPLNNRKVTHYSLSPDGRFVFITSDTPYSSFDAPDRPISGWMKIDGQQYFELWGESDFQTFGWNPVAMGVLWRPAVITTGP